MTTNYTRIKIFKKNLSVIEFENENKSHMKDFNSQFYLILSIELPFNISRG